MAETKATINEISFTKYTDSNGWTVLTMPGLTIFQKKISPDAGTGASQTATAISATPFPVGENWDTVAQQMLFSIRVGTTSTGLAGDVRAVARGAAGSSTFDTIVTAGASTTAFITATIVKIN